MLDMRFYLIFVTFTHLFSPSVQVTCKCNQIIFILFVFLFNIPDVAFCTFMPSLSIFLIFLLSLGIQSWNNVTGNLSSMYSCNKAELLAVIVCPWNDVDAISFTAGCECWTWVGWEGGEKTIQYDCKWKFEHIWWQKKGKIWLTWSKMKTCQQVLRVERSLSVWLELWNIL